jgi:hypothetical protein
MDRDSPYIDWPVWPWSLAGWLVAAGALLTFIAAWLAS